MNREALKFTDLESFFEVIEEMGYNGEISSLLYEQGKLPYCTAYFIPTHLLPNDFNFDAIDQFNGRLAQVEEIQYLGIEKFNADFMIFPVSLTGYVEVDFVGPVTFVPEASVVDWSKGEMNFVINVKDGGGKEFLLTAQGTLVGLTEPNQGEPHIFKNHKQVTKQLDLLRQRYPKTCQVYGIEKREYEARRQVLLNPDN